MTLAMFPLGTVLVPGFGLPLHVFEPRYQAMVHDCLAGDRELGVVLIERGHEVGGGDVRTDVGTVGRIVEANHLSRGRWSLGVVGTRRIRVVRWLDDDPYPRAEVLDWPDPEPGPEHSALLGEALGRLRRALAIQAELDRPGPPATIDLAQDPVVAGYQALALAPITAFDRHRLLAVGTPEERAQQLGELLGNQIELLEAEMER